MRPPLTQRERLAMAAWASGDHRPRCDEAHLTCRGCGACVCAEVADGLGASLTTRVRVSTDTAGHTWCQECRYEWKEYGNLREGHDVDDRPSLAAWRNFRNSRRSA